ncbi:MAG: DUF1289 domain-containing protein [Ramlibacter sp.]|nr:DUF1289 domain-containing protein [Ramlibacter sp.]
MSAARLLAERARLVASSDPGDVPSPCISVCRMDPITQWCEGCFRTLEEIAQWGGSSPEEKVRIWQTIALRVQQS